MSALVSIFTVWLRHFAVFRKNIVYGMITTFVEPLLYLFSFGFGLGSVIGTIQVGNDHLSYRAFVLAGLVGQAVLFTSFFDGAYGGFVRMYYQRIFQAISVTPITLSEVLWGELLWCASRGVLSAATVLLMGFLIGDFSAWGCVVALPVIFLVSFFFASVGMLVAASSQTIESISYPQYLAIFPMFLFCGVYFPLAQLPQWAQGIAAFLPLTALLSVVRFLLLGFEWEWWSLPILLFWFVLFVPWARSAMRKRMVN
ncbi:MAG: ABC transporter permease [Bdellovibrionales bacterium]|nr:ABC transporter permease [Bdellovibrionales bacterium]